MGLEWAELPAMPAELDIEARKVRDVESTWRLPHLRLD